MKIGPINWIKTKLFLIRKLRERGDLWVFWCRMCAARIADPDGELSRAIYCPHCGSGGRSDYDRAFWIEKVLFFLNLQGTYWKKIGYVRPGRSARQAAAVRMMLERIEK